MNQYLTYNTLQGDTFDSISLDFYDEEYYASEIIKSNPDLGGILIFEEGVKLNIPILDIKDNDLLPPWKR